MNLAETTIMPQAGPRRGRIGEAFPDSRLGNGYFTRQPLGSRIVSINTERLTDREREILSLVAEGCSNKVIAANLAIAETTVKSHLTNIMTKLWASDRTHAVVTAVRLGWLAI